MIRRGRRLAPSPSRNRNLYTLHFTHAENRHETRKQKTACSLGRDTLPNLTSMQRADAPEFRCYGNPKFCTDYDAHACKTFVMYGEGAIVL
jgi:hypothetical protein